ncbi:radical SAM family heme chaperone HemW [Reichenbachiella sp. MALMAid0571]|uniref:radical SAM family heme chaperone HemW n=1 Tax=Reichenbachiella sp. MALMAid0571 TaxID=3143939 RepID=UPI0032DEDB5C
MAGIYIHIPYCKQACHYCDFHFSTYLRTKPDLVDAICKEIRLQKSYLSGEPIKTIYFGGGTPSLLSSYELEKILNTITENFSVSKNPEVTLEANPDDLSEENLYTFKSRGINRLSIGIQSFNDNFLHLFNRAHTSQMATKAVSKAKNVGFDNISVDLIFGVPNQTLQQFQKDLEKIIALDTQHISIYGLTIEENTTFGKWKKTNKIQPIDEEVAASQFELIMDVLASSGFHQYEISNFSKPGFESQHNSSYWKGEQYLGLGPGAHSFNGNSRQFNIRNNSKYIKAIDDGQIPCNVELLTNNQKLNEYILTKIRTAKGISLKEIKDRFNFDFAGNYTDKISLYKNQGLIELSEYLMLTREGKLVADSITENFIVD